MNEEKKDLPCTIAPELLEAWKRLQLFGDVTSIKNATGYSPLIIRRALKYGYVLAPELPDLINKFFSNRLEQQREVAKKLMREADRVQNKEGGKA